MLTSNLAEVGPSSFESWFLQVFFFEFFQLQKMKLKKVLSTYLLLTYDSIVALIVEAFFGPEWSTFHSLLFLWVNSPSGRKYGFSGVFGEASNTTRGI